MEDGLINLMVGEAVIFVQVNIDFNMYTMSDYRNKCGFVCIHELF
jgi:hypothetical protein